jgi:hypothetical protein
LLNGTFWWINPLGKEFAIRYASYALQMNPQPDHAARAVHFCLKFAETGDILADWLIDEPYVLVF